jgi:CYTH domain-containing protein
MHKIEKKYLLKDSIKTLIDDLKLPTEDISEFYTVVKVCKEVKFSKINAKYFKTTKNGVIGSIEQNRVKIKKSLYNKEKKNAIGQHISKKRYLLLNNGEKYSLDKYQKNLKNLYLLEVEFKNQSNFNKFTVPEKFKNYVIKEVTNDKRYQKRNLALLGNPKKNPYNIYSIFKDIELARITNLNKTIFKEMKTSDAVRIVLYNLFVELRINQDLIVQTDAKRGIKAFESALKKSIILLNEYKSIFDKKIVRNVKLHLKIMNKALKPYKDLLFIQKELSTIHALIEPSEIDRIYKSIEYKLASEKHNISRFFKTREFAIIFKQYELLLKENNKSFLSVSAQISIGNSIKYNIYNHYKKTIMKCNKYERCNDDLSYKTINKSINRVKTLLEEFEMILDKEKYKTMYTLTCEVSKQLATLKNINRKKMIIDTYLENLEVKPKNYQKLLKKIKKERTINSSKMNDALHNSMLTFKKKKHFFK